jgi:hypothetical protein
VCLVFKQKDEVYVLAWLLNRKLRLFPVQVKTGVCDLIVRAAAVRPDIGLLVVNTLTRSPLALSVKHKVPYSL